MDKQPTPVPEADLRHPLSRKAFRTVKVLVGGYLALSVLTLGVVALLRDDATAVNPAVWTRAGIVVASALFTRAFAVRAARGSRGAYRRLRIVSGVMVIAIVAIVALPGTFPLWMKTEQAVCGLLLLGVVLIVNGRHLRSQFAAR
ncbi:hypothetical protein [Streptomyces mobaraensis]|uniref:Integral membrane protein n=1 Tax=Streptomyces mobaraensis (strain ATCC 29032 / DSM 40847 / JCM 4168 / NBRC 13819 / NCIMB 11159 / IPCR 16-22) TaxID=1223523 RepID=M3C708_STRM1|nr:hypothetical protein [Streptomyces mobaraensis]EME99726.1 integral membrane protein [Streptomyces mobaraensis NBRC 13819 = DSM 40847]